MQKEKLEHHGKFGLYRIDDLVELLRVGRSTIYLWVKEGRFPKPVKLSRRVSGWLRSDVHAWLEARKEEIKEENA
ncbi:helix-turn-helix transcriptional regulator [Thermodesulfobacterium hydrogeniphilum]|uniref:helix-turn-helix transcriptional regulator n=1 Tax=Thermodesulfobacterium hydrogeniphilum TaxID=161156 RepID=UPI000571E3C7|nr:AlpA family phage regulatory protein [Thermodesulfobacterium hydrogeniphilum]